MDSQSRTAPIRWSKEDQNLIAGWLEKRNDKMEWVNLDALTKLENHTQSGTKDIRDDTGLSIQQGMSGQKAAEKIKLLIKSFQKGGG